MVASTLTPAFVGFVYVSTMLEPDTDVANDAEARLVLLTVVESNDTSEAAIFVIVPPADSQNAFAISLNVESPKAPVAPAVFVRAVTEAFSEQVTPYVVCVGIGIVSVAVPADPTLVA